MPNWTGATADASAAERATAYVVARVLGSPDVMKEIAVADLVAKDANGNASIFNAPLQAGGANIVLIGRQSSAFPTGAGKGYFELRTVNTDATNGGMAVHVLASGVAVEVARFWSDGSVGFGLTNPTVIGRVSVAGSATKSVGIATANNGTTSVPAETNMISCSYSVDGSNPVGIFSLNSFSNNFEHWLGFKTTSAAGTTALRWIIDGNGHYTPAADNAVNVGSASKRVGTYYGVTGTINTSDERAKKDIGAIPDAWLDAWGAVEWCRFKFTDGNRWHVGLIAQRVYAAFEALDLDAFEIGLCCWDEWAEEQRPIYRTETRTRRVQVPEYVPAGVDADGEPLFALQQVERTEEYEVQVDTGETEFAQQAGDRWGLRYDECQAMEAAWQRRELRRLHTRLAQLEAR